MVFPQMVPPGTVLQPEFLEQLRAMQPDLCITAAYGNILPKAFLQIPRHGTLNIHPSLLPQYRGAAPVQRALQVASKPYSIFFIAHIQTDKSKAWGERETL